MRIVAPAEIASVAWEGELIPPSTFKSPGSSKRPVVTIGQSEIWSAWR